MRMRVSDVLDLLASGATRQEILEDYPFLEDADISAALAFGSDSLSHMTIAAE
jgi:uncharacterized protein (DUF433 family)